MAKGSEVMEMLRPDGGWIMEGNDFEGIIFLECEPITKKEFLDGFKQYDAWKEQTELVNAQAKAALLEKLGITEDEAKLLLS